MLKERLVRDVDDRPIFCIAIAYEQTSLNECVQEPLAFGCDGESRQVADTAREGLFFAKLDRD